MINKTFVLTAVSVHDGTPCSLPVDHPLGHCKQTSTEVCRLDFENVSTGHSEHSSFEVNPTFEEYRPERQGLQCAMDVAAGNELYVPCWHDTQVALDEAPSSVPYVPARQLVHCSAETCLILELYFPFEHFPLQL